MSRGRKSNKRLDSETFLRLMQIFKEKSWEIDDDDANQLSLFNRFSNILSELTKEEQLLVLELTERFTWVTMDKYFNHINNILKKVVEHGAVKLSSITNIYIAPLISPEDFGKSKSSTTVQYLFRGILTYNQHFANKKCIFTEDLIVNGEDINREDSILFVVDDFVGTGETAGSAINYLTHEKNVKQEKIVILSIAALYEGVEYIQDLNILIYYSLIFNKGITDYYASSEVPIKLEIMDSIEKKIKVHKNEKYGFKSSEALIKLIRTPNNTFPFYWKEKKGRIAPFPRN